MNEAFQKDCLEILAGKVERGEISRRRFTQLAAMLFAGAPFALRAGAASAADQTACPGQLGRRRDEGL